MAKLAKLIEQILLGRSDANIGFDELCQILTSLGFSQRTRGSHHIFSHPDVLELINLQRDGGKAKPYQVRQVRAIILQYKLGAEE
ncbi:type II toxin-antitoxin system HicA family toxin [uncultured Thiobacillus sp.]|uniref:type II toxin-antitoxin system HicA family toxin n=1 Tax=uncultured Thiobacillus sp. TaxID=189996 RepID=UPI0009262598|nr:type II toxin-antitoxin system HicA family toxin [uncultured Thiobacillus sp.]OJW55229.1 MAG: toxin HicA [Thiobacillus sp. 65-1059]